jgi:hypothetical protein
MFQAGYLTVESSVRRLPGRMESDAALPQPGGAGQPERQPAATPHRCGAVQANAGRALYRPAAGQRLPALQTLFHAFFASIPHDWYRKNELLQL